MPLLCSSIGTAAVATIYVIYGAYRDHLHQQIKRERTIRERVTYMLWTMVQQMD